MAFRLSASARCSICAAFGLALVFVWSALSDHTFNLRAALPESMVTNPRVFFLLGILALSAVFVIKPKTTRTVDTGLGVLLSFVGSVGTACIALAPYQSLFPPSMLCLTGLVSLGAAYCWFVTSYGLLLARSGSISRIVYCLAVALTIEPFLRVSIESLLEHTLQAGVAMALPLLAMLLLAYVRKTVEQEDAARPAAQSEQRPGGKKFGRLFVPLFSVALLLATVRTLSPVGTWDAKFDPTPMTSSPELMVLYIAGVFLFAKFALVGLERKPYFIRLQPAFLLIVLTLLASLILISHKGAQSSLLYALMVVDDSFAHMLFWAEVVFLIGTATMAPRRAAGLGLIAYTAMSIVWLIVLGDEDTLQAPVMFIAVASIYLLTMLVSQTSVEQWGRRRRNDHADADGDAHAEPEADDTAAADDHIVSVKNRCQDIAVEYKLSPRETEVFMLLAQGRTRAYIQEELVLAENTVKTHISHIYKKLEVGNRQEMLDLVFTPLQSGKDE